MQGRNKNAGGGFTSAAGVLIEHAGTGTKGAAITPENPELPQSRRDAERIIFHEVHEGSRRIQS
jgi:hypothetical protein